MHVVTSNYQAACPAVGHYIGYVAIWLTFGTLTDVSSSPLYTSNSSFLYAELDLFLTDYGPASPARSPRARASKRRLDVKPQVWQGDCELLLWYIY